MEKEGLIAREIIGLHAAIKVKAGGTASSGTIIDETKNTIMLRTEKDDKRFGKEQIIITIDGQSTDGKEFMGRPEERIKKWQKNKR